MEEGAIVDGPDGTAYIVRGGQLVPMGAPAAQPSFAPVTLGQADPTKAALAQLQLARGQTDLAAAARAAANAPVDTRILNARAAEAEANAAIAQRNATTNNQRSGVTPAVRAASIAGYKTSQQLRRLIGEMETLYKQGPGSTQGVSSLTDYLPTTVNKRFDAAGNAARGIVGSALGFTGGQLNTAAEAAMAVGPYLPQASDRDEVIQDKIKRLRDLADQAEQRSIAQLGGRPDQNGNIQPVTGSAAAGGQGGSGAQGGGGGAQQPMSPSPFASAGSATGTEKKVRDESKSPAVAALQTLLRSGAPDDQVQAAAAALNASPGSVSAALDFRRKNPGYRGSYDLGDLGTRTERTSGFERLAASPIGAYFANAANAGTAGLLGAATGTAEDFRRLSKENPTAGLLGEITGAGLGAAGLELGLGAAAARTGINALARPVLADAAFGGVSGATATPDNPVLGAVAGASLGAGGGMFGRAAGRTIGRGFRGIQNANVGALRQAGVPLTVGQAVGGALKGVEDRLAGVPVIGDIIGNRRREGLAAFNGAINNDAVAPLATQSNPLNVTIGATGEQGVEALRQANSAGYRNAVAGRFASADPAYDAAYQTARTQAGAIPNTGPTVQAELDAISPGYFAAGQISGDNARAAVSELRALRSARRTDPLGNRTGEAIRGAENAMIDLFERQSPGFAGDLAAANRVNGNVKTIETAVRNAGRNDGIYTPAQLDRAAQQSAARFGNNAATTQRPFFDLTRAAQNVLPSQVPDSGTAGRLALLGLPAAFGGTGGGVGYATGDAQTGAAAGLGVGAALALGGSRGAQALAVRGLADRPDALIRIGNGLYNRAALGGMFGAGLGSSIPLLAQP